MHSDSSTRLVAIIFSVFFCALGLSGAWSSPSTAPVHAAGPIIVMATPPLVVPTVQPTQAPTAAPLPTPEPVVVVQYVEVPVVEYVPIEAPQQMPATVAPPAIVLPPGETAEQPPFGGRGSEPSGLGGRPNLNPGPPNKAQAGDMPEAVAP